LGKGSCEQPHLNGGNILNHPPSQLKHHSTTCTCGTRGAGTLKSLFHRGENQSTEMSSNLPEITQQSSSAPLFLSARSYLQSAYLPSVKSGLGWAHWPQSQRQSLLLISQQWVWASAGGSLCNPSYSGGRDQEVCSSKPAPGKYLIRSYLKKYLPPNRTGGVAQVVEQLPSKCEALSSNPSTHWYFL
jgi:hypothetical protein